MESKYVRSTYEENLYTTNSRNAQNTSSLGLINHMLAKPRSNVATEAIFKPGVGCKVTVQESCRGKDALHHESSPSNYRQKRRPVIIVKKLKSTLRSGASLDNLDKENSLNNSPIRTNSDAAKGLIISSNHKDFRKPVSPRLSRLHQVTVGAGPPGKDIGADSKDPADAGVGMGSRSNAGPRPTSEGAAKGARLRSKSSSRVLEAGSDSGRSISLGIFGTSSTSRASTGKSAVEMLEASKSLYVKSAQVRERKQEPTFSGVLQVTSLSTDPTMLVSMTRDGVAPPHAGREVDDAGAMSDGGLIEAVASTRNSKPGSLSFAPTPILVHHSALRLKDIQASSSGELLDATASPTSSSSSSSRDLLGETPSTGDDVLDRFSRHSPAIAATAAAAAASTTFPSTPPNHSSSRSYRPGNAAATKPRNRTNVKTVSNSNANFKDSILPIESEALHASAKKLSIVSDASTTSDEEPWKREGHHAKKSRQMGVEVPSSDLSCPTESDVDRSIPDRISSAPHRSNVDSPRLRPILTKNRTQALSLDDPANKTVTDLTDEIEDAPVIQAGGLQKVFNANLQNAQSNADASSRALSTGDSVSKKTLTSASPRSRPFHRDGRDSGTSTKRTDSSRNGGEPFADGASPGRGAHGVQRSKSDAGGKSCATSPLPNLLQQKHSPDLDRFFDSMGIDQSILLSTSDSVDWDALGGGNIGTGRPDAPGSSKAHGDSGSSLDSFPKTGSEHIRSTGSDFGDDEDGEGAGFGRGGRGPLAGRNSRDVSVIERNARVIKWLCNVSKAKERTITQ